MLKRITHHLKLNSYTGIYFRRRTTLLYRKSKNLFARRVRHYFSGNTTTTRNMIQSSLSIWPVSLFIAGFTISSFVSYVLGPIEETDEDFERYVKIVEQTTRTLHKEDYFERLLIHAVLGKVNLESMVSKLSAEKLSKLYGFKGPHLILWREMVTSILEDVENQPNLSKLDEDYISFLRKFRDDLDRSIPIAYTVHFKIIMNNLAKMRDVRDAYWSRLLYFEEQIREPLKGIHEKIINTLSSMKLGERLIIPAILSSKQDFHCIYFVFEKSNSENANLVIFDSSGCYEQIFKKGMGALEISYRAVEHDYLKRSFTDIKYENLSIDIFDNILNGLLKLLTNPHEVDKHNMVYRYLKESLGDPKDGEKKHSLQRFGVCTWKPLDKMVAEWTTRLYKWRFKVDYRSYIFNLFLKNVVENEEVMNNLSEDEKQFIQLLTNESIKIIEKNRKKYNGLLSKAEVM